MSEVIQFRHHDCWRTWFFEECETFGLFGINEKHLGLVRLTGIGIHPYHLGTEVFLEDAPVFHASSDRFHRVCGPYEVTSAEPLPLGAVVVHTLAGVPIVYKELRPQDGPWLDGTKHRKGVCGLDFKHRQIAKQFNFFPYRFRIRRTPRWQEISVFHSRTCELRDG